MSPLQIGALVIGLLIVASYLVDFKSILRKVKMPVEGKVISNDEEFVIKKMTPEKTLAELVAEWESLKVACEQNGLVEAANKLAEVFPLFLKKA